MALTMATESRSIPVADGMPLFSQVFFHVVTNSSLNEDEAEKICHRMISLGAIEHARPSRSGLVSLRGLTHIITATTDFEGYDAASDAFINVVTPKWIDISMLKGRLANPKSHSPDPRLFYSGLVVCTADLPEGDKDAIIGGVLAMGGLYSGSISKLVTHLVALSLEPRACQIALTKDLPCKIVLPHWFDDCLRLGRRIAEGPYLLPNPEVMRKTPGNSGTTLLRPNLGSAVSIDVGSLPALDEIRSKEREQINVFKGKSVMLGNDLGIADHLRKTIENIVEQGGGEIARVVSDSHILICQYREGNEYTSASSSGKIVGNLPWLYHLVLHNTWTSPMRRLLHYPIARNGLPGFKNFRVSLSNYNGEARLYLENLARAAGCEFTKTMKQDNTHLITAHTISEKCEAAKEWNIHIINHLWLEESYAKWQIQSVSNSRYTHFPPRTNLSEVVGQTQLDKCAIHQNFVAKTSKGVGFSLQPNRPQGIAKGTSNLFINTHSVGTDCKSSETDNSMARYHQIRTPSRRGIEVVDAVNTSPVESMASDNKENKTPSTSGGRGAKEKATARLHDLAPDIALYEKEKKRVGGVVFGGRRKKGEVVEPGRKRSSPTPEKSEMDEFSAARAPKRAKSFKPPLRMRVLVTGYTRWTENAKVYAKERDRLRALGLLLTQDYKNCSYLAAPKILRTQKFCCAIAQCPIVLSTRFLEACIEENDLLDPKDYLLYDSVGEKLHGLKMSDVLTRASTNKGRLLRGETIWITEGIHGGYDSYKAIVEMNGGKCVLYRGRPSLALKEKTSGGSDEDEEVSDCVFLISGITNTEAKLWPRFRQMVRAAGLRPKIVNTEWMLDLALTQQIQWKDEYECTETEFVGKNLEM